ncbi:MAG: winged helix-turn-helix transcriptional regulator [Thermoplasmata archaeon]|nr:winged helix-turn-helix transcriptional regulator [Thermoplasmata archaeon]
MIGASRMRVELDKKSIMALASDTRLDILKSLQPMRRTVTQLSEELSMDKAGVHRHLKKLEDGGLVKRYEDHGFVYYGLTWKSRDLLSPGENTKVVILLSAFWVLSLVLVLYIAAAMMSNSGNDTLSGLLPMDGSSEYASDRSDSSDDVDSAVLIAPFLVLGAAMVVLVVITFRRMRKPLQARPEAAIGIDCPPELNDDD